MNTTQPKAANDYGTGWKAARAKAQQLADAYGKPVTVYREVVDNRPAGFKNYMEGDNVAARPGDAYRLETIQPTKRPRKVVVTVTDLDGVILDRRECEVRDGVRELVVMEVLPGTRMIEHQVASVAIGDGE